MSDPINAWLDGELPLEELSAREQAEALALKSAIRSASARLTREPAPDLTARVMAALPPAREPAPRPAVAPGYGVLAGLRTWLGSLIPPSGSLRPALTLTAAALVIGFGLGRLAVPAGPANGGAGLVADAPDAQLFVRFELEAAGAEDVRLAGSFTDWEARYELTPLGDGRWSVTVPLEPGVHDYLFVLDGERYAVDPYAPRVADGFGGYNSRLALLTPGH
jgi:hypothetical protein